MQYSKKITPKAFVFDLGNTLFNDAQTTQDSIAEMGTWLFENSMIESGDVFVSTYTRVNDEDFTPFISHTFGEVDFFEKTFQELGVTAISPQDALLRYREIVAARFIPEQDLLDTFQFLKENGFKIALLSNERVSRVDEYMERTGFKKFFDTVIVSEDVGIEKPDLRIFEEALTRLNIQAEEMVMCGDNVVADGACKQLGIFFILVTGYRKEGWIWEQGEPQSPDYVMEKITKHEIEAFLTDAEKEE